MYSFESVTTHVGFMRDAFLMSSEGWQNSSRETHPRDRARRFGGERCAKTVRPLMSKFARRREVVHLGDIPARAEQKNHRQIRRKSPAKMLAEIMRVIRRVSFIADDRA